jgi:hypothetical protein
MHASSAAKAASVLVSVVALILIAAAALFGRDVRDGWNPQRMPFNWVSARASRALIQGLGLATSAGGTSTRQPSWSPALRGAHARLLQEIFSPTAFANFAWRRSKLQNS